MPSAGSWQRRLNSTSSGGRRDTGEKDVADEPRGPNQDQLPHVSEEAAQTAKILEKKCGEVGGPELEQGTPVEEILSRDKDALKNMPKVLRDQIASRSKGGSRTFSTSARLQQEDVQDSTTDPTDPSVAAVADMIAAAGMGAEVEEKIGYKFDPPSIPLPKSEHVKRRYEPLMDQFTKMLMKDGKLSLAQKHMTMILDHLRTSPPPAINPTRPLLPGPPSPQLPLNPILYLTQIVDSVAPLIRIRQLKGVAGGGMSLAIPQPLRLRQRRRFAIKWILEASEKRRDSQFARRVAHEVIAVAEGRSSVWEKRSLIHKQGTAARSNLRYAGGAGKRRASFSPPLTIQPGQPQWVLQPLRADSHPSTSTRWKSSACTNHHGDGFLSSYGGFDGGISTVGGGGGEGLEQEMLFDADQLQGLLQHASASGGSDQFLTGQNSVLGLGHGAVGDSVTSAPSWEEGLNFDGGGAGFDGMSGAVENSVDLSGLNDLIECGGGSGNLDPEFANSCPNDYFHTPSTNDAISHTTNHVYLPSSFGTTNKYQGAGFRRSLSSKRDVQPATSNSSFDTASQNPASSSSSITQSPPDSAPTPANPRRRKHQSASLDPVAAAEDKRRRNTLAARRFRQRQQDRITQLERALEDAARERDELKMKVAKSEGEVAALRQMLGKKPKA
ncbi:hypothetical protein PRK78_003837 [Emydomyces testavorans]|uniref:Small ribosomal subunit protein uS7m n=1 Tax=Emydomyces testavorans TaxID=2070801 RepID=A0AAF0DHL5_9EURO|nr:hypothetical protein PRK78_003837 [Emydomyces testavorans]